MKGLLRLWTIALGASLGACIVPVYGTGPATNEYCPPSGSCADGGTSGSSGGSNFSGGTSTSSGTGGTTTSGTTTSGSSSSGSSTGGSSTNASSSGSSSSSSSGASDGGCAAHDGGTELQPCGRASDCNCPEQCVAIPGGGNYCETPCTSFSDCASVELCANGYCAFDTCPAPTVFNVCAAGNDAGGYCLPEPDPAAAGGVVGICLPSGSADGGCNPATAEGPWSSWNAAEACKSGEFCFPVSANAGVCVGLCDGGAACPANTTCSFDGTNPFVGYCLPCPGANEVSCGLACFDPTTDDLNCGGCNNACQPGTACFAGRCTRPAPLIFPRYGLAAATGPDGLIYAVGGQSGPIQSGLVEAFNPRANGWGILPSMSTQRSGLAASWAGNGQLYAIGGFGTGTNCVGFCTTSEAFDPTTQSWSIETQLPESHVGPALGVDSSGLLYLAGGGGLFGATDNLYVLDAGWDPLQILATPRQFTVGAFGFDGRFYVLGGQGSGGQALASIEAYDPVHNQWDETLPSLPTPVWYLGAVAKRTEVYAVGGGADVDGGFAGQAAVSRLDLRICDAGACAWRQDAPLQQPRGGHAATLGPDGRLYALGGLVQYSGTRNLSFGGLQSVEVYDPSQPDGGWVSSVCPFVSFETPDAGYAAGRNPGSEIAVGDLNNDMFPDVVTLSNSSFSVFLNNQSGGLLGGTSLSADAGVDGLHGLALADFNQDGNLDAIAVVPDYNLMALGLGDGKGGLGAKPTAYTTTDGTAQTVGARGTAVADFNGDGWPDVAVANAGGSTIGILLNQKNSVFGTFKGFNLSSFPTCTTPVQVVAADLNADGAPDLVVLCAPGSGGTVAILFNNGSGTAFGSSEQLTVSNPTSVAIADFNLDGLPDIAIGTSGPTGVTVFLNQGGSSPVFLTGAAGSRVTSGGLSVTLADLNGDGYPDIVGSDYQDQTEYLFLNTGGTGLLATGIYAIPNGDSPAAATVADMRLNGWNDLLTLNYTANTVNVWFSDCPP